MDNILYCQRGKNPVTGKDETRFHLRKAAYDLSFLELMLLEYFFGTQKEGFDSASQWGFQMWMFGPILFFISFLDQLDSEYAKETFIWFLRLFAYWEMENLEILEEIARVSMAFSRKTMK